MQLGRGMYVAVFERQGRTSAKASLRDICRLNLWLLILRFAPHTVLSLGIQYPSRGTSGLPSKAGRRGGRRTNDRKHSSPFSSRR